MPKAIWNGKVIAESDDTVMIEGNHYFPRESIDAAFLSSSESHTICPWKGVASYYNLVVDGKTNADAARYYPDPKQGPAAQIKGYVAFWKGVKVSD